MAEEFAGADGVGGAVEGDAAETRCERVEHGEGGGDDFGADAIAGQNGERETGHAEERRGGTDDAGKGRESSESGASVPAGAAGIWVMSQSGHGSLGWQALGFGVAVLIHVSIVVHVRRRLS